MAKVFPFRGIRYNLERVGDLSRVVTQPYDKITPEMQEEYYRRSPYNVVRLILNREPGERRYQQARELLDRWLTEGVLIRDERPTIYAYYQEYQVEGGARLTRKGFIALAELREYGQGVLPHERTLSAPKEDRLKLMRATQANLGQIFVLYSDPELTINRVLDREIAGRPPLTAVDGFDPGTVHRLWLVQDERAQEEIVELMQDKTLFIADGHHRYETALAYRDEIRAKGVGWSAPASSPGSESEPESPENVMLTFVNMDDRGLTIFPTHRLIHELPEGLDLDQEALERKLKEHFTLERFAPGEEERLLEGLRAGMAQGKHLFGLLLRGLPAHYLLALKDERVMDELVPDRSPAWRRLDVTICHRLLLEELLGIGPDQVEGKIGYLRSAREAIELVREGKEAGVILLNPTRIEEVRQIARNGERMPQKSTDFYPKMLTGLVLNKFCLGLQTTEA